MIIAKCKDTLFRGVIRFMAIPLATNITIKKKELLPLFRLILMVQVLWRNLKLFQ